MDIHSNEGASEHDVIRKFGDRVDALILRLRDRELRNSDAHANETEGAVSPSANSSRRWILHACDNLMPEATAFGLWRMLASSPGV